MYLLNLWVSIYLTCKANLACHKPFIGAPLKEWKWRAFLKLWMSFFWLELVMELLCNSKALHLKIFVLHCRTAYIADMHYCFGEQLNIINQYSLLTSRSSELALSKVPPLILFKTPSNAADIEKCFVISVPKTVSTVIFLNLNYSADVRPARILFFCVVSSLKSIYKW